MQREDILQALGRIPQRAETPARRSLAESRDGISRYLVRYETEPGEQVTAWLLVPEGGRDCPAVVACHQHNDEYFVGKSEPAGFYAKAANTFGLTLCRAGFAVLCPDQIGFEDRRPAEYARRANPCLEGQNYERYLFMEYLLKGSSLQAKNIADLTRAVDILGEQPEVDSERIGVCGHSLGGQEALWLAWYDSRIKALAASCGFARIHDLQKRAINHDYSMYLPGFLQDGDMEDLLRTLCPKPAYIGHGALDPIYPKDSVERVMELGRQAYEQAGFGERFCARIFEDVGHVFEEEQQREAVEFLLKWV